MQLWFPSLQQLEDNHAGDQEKSIFTAQKAIDWFIIYSFVM